MKAWWYDFEFSRKEIYVRETDIRVPITRENTRDFLKFFAYFCIEKSYNLRRLFKKPTARIACIPSRPRAWYLLWATSYRAGFDLSSPLSKADAVFYFEDQTHISPRDIQHGLPSFNAQCRDISKSHVQAVFEQVFGYALAVDPQTHTGKMVVKSELNGRHDGGIIEGPCYPKEGYVYQRVIDTIEDGYAVDLRCPTISGCVDLIYVKRRPEGKRFDNFNSACKLAKPEDHLSEDERVKLSEFAAAMQLDWGGLDVLRDTADGRIYVVDVNKTDMGPPLILPLIDKLRSVSILSKSLTRALTVKLDEAKL